MADLAVTSAGPRDLDGIRALLEAVGLSTEGVAEGLAGFMVARHRGRRLTARVVESLLRRSWAQGDHAVYLLTADAAGYFRRFGFLQTDRAAVPGAVLASGSLGLGLAPRLWSWCWRDLTGRRARHPSNGRTEHG